jgi:excisionase family DNA binding protein
MASETPIPAPAPLLLKADEVAGLLSIGRSTLWRLVSAGQVPSPLHVGRAARWRRGELEAWLAAGAPSADRWAASQQGGPS